MFALAHIYIGTKVFRSDDPQVVFGSILPDYVWNDRNLLNKNNLHYHPFEFYDFISRHHPRFLPLAQAVLTHTDISNGVDKYSDNEKDGYAMKLGKSFINDIGKGFGLDDKKALDFAHNFIEVAVEIHLARAKPTLTAHFVSSLFRNDFESINELLSKFSGVSVSIVASSIEHLLQFYLRNDFASENEFIKVPLTIIARQRFKISKPSKAVFKKVLLHAEQVTQRSYRQFLDSTAQAISAEHKNFLFSS